MVKLKFETKGPRWRPRLRWLLLPVLLFAIVLVLGVDRWRGRTALARWEREMASKGEVFDAERLWPAPSAESSAFSNRLAQIIGQLPERLWEYGGWLAGVQPGHPGKSRRGSQEAQPRLPSSWSPTPAASWADLGGLIGQAQPALKSLRDLIRYPPADMGYDIREMLRLNSTPSFMTVRCGAQALHAAAINDLHENNLAGALANLTALSGFVSLYAKEPTLVVLMIRVAIMGVMVDGSWDALQAKGWTEPQLRAFQQVCQDENLSLEQMYRALEGERALRLHNLDWLRSHSYDRWIARWEPLFKLFAPATRAASGPLNLWRECVFHPLWRFAWADQEELLYLKTMQKELTALRAAAHDRSWVNLHQAQQANVQEYRPPKAAWRFYISLPLTEMWDASGSQRPAGPVYPIPVFVRAWLATMESLTWRQMLISAIALKRYELRHGQFPGSLQALVPEFLRETPTDFMDGKPLRYRLTSPGSFTLYSVGQNGLDEGGDSRPSTADTRDWVWPRVLAIQNDAAAKAANHAAPVVTAGR